MALSASAAMRNDLKTYEKNPNKHARCSETTEIYFSRKTLIDIHLATS